MIDLTRGRSHNVLRYTGNPLDVMFMPRSVAVIGASEREGSIGRAVLSNLIDSDFPGTVYAVNPFAHTVLALPSYPTITAVPEKVDLAVITTPAEAVLEVVRDCVAAKVPACVIISAGFKETGPAGAALEQAILAEARGKMRIVGPNCLGIMNPYYGLNATFTAQMATPGNVGFISQSGAMFSAILDWSLQENVGFSSFVSTGSMVDVDWGDLIYYFGDDPHTKSILIYMETIGDARSFMSAAREVALTKPIIVMKPGRSPEAARAAAAHTGADVGDDEAIEAAFRRCGVLRVEAIADLFNLGEVLGKQPRPHGPRLMIVTNAGGPGVSATDAVIAAGGELARLSPPLLAALDEVLPANWSRINPVDMLGDADPARYRRVIELVSKDADSDGLLVILTPQAMSKPGETAVALTSIYDRPAGYPYGKPVLASWMGGAAVAEGTAVLNQANIPTFAYADTAARMFTLMWRYQRRLGALYETPHVPSGADEAALQSFLTGEVIAEIRASGRTRLNEYEAQRVLEAYGIPVVETILAETVDRAAAAAAEVGYPVWLKACMGSSAGRVEDSTGARLQNEDEVRRMFATLQEAPARAEASEHFDGVLIQPAVDLRQGYELALSSRPDPQLGPVLRFGVGGALGDYLSDSGLGIPPLNSTLARRMMEPTAIYQAMSAFEGAEPLDMVAVEDLLVRFSHLVVQQRWIKQIEINPILVAPGQMLALEATIELYGLDVQEQDLPRLAIRPYPIQYVQSFANRKGLTFTIRPIRPEDEPLLADFHTRLSEESVYLRYFRAFQLDQRVEHERLTRLCFIDYDRTLALVVTWQNLETGADEMVAVGRLTRLPDPSEAEFAILVRDDFQGQGLGTVLLEHLLLFGRDEGIDKVSAYMLAANKGMINICKRLGFRFEREDDLLKAVIDLNGTPLLPEETAVTSTAKSPAEGE
jgi:acetyltransferase